MSVEPDRLTTLRDQWKQAKERDARPVKDSYLDSLVNKQCFKRSCKKGERIELRGFEIQLAAGKISK